VCFRNLICCFSQRSLWNIISSIYYLLINFFLRLSRKLQMNWRFSALGLSIKPDQIRSWLDWLSSGVHVWLTTYFYEQSLVRSVDVIVRNICIVNISTIICPLNYRMKEMFFEDDIDDSKYCGHLYGLGTNFVVGSNNNNSSMSKTFSLNIPLF
jgi:hypothetical protein